MQVSIDVVSDSTPLIQRQVKAAGEQAVTKAALNIEARAKLGITRQDAIDTGATKVSIHAQTTRDRKYSRAIGRARVTRGPGKHTKVTKKYVPVFGEIIPSGPLEAIVAVGTQYAQYIEHGTKFMAPRPFLEPAADAVISNLEDIVINEINKML